MRRIFVTAAIAAFLLCTGIAASAQNVQTVHKTPEQVAQSLIDAYNARDMDGILKAYASDSTAYALPTGEVILKGHDAIRKKFARVLEPNVKLKVEIVSRIVDGKYVIDKEKISGTADGKPIEFYGTVIYEIVDGMIRKEWYPRQE
ncbi:MAG TPA: nuclear transport factor 2 family protein [Pyrinomonadaceae bacterium]|nr:nuclear transport factor 2 family protein [Pyrinomonadaceae bacterium]